MPGRVLPAYVVVCRILVYDQKQSTDRQRWKRRKKARFPVSILYRSMPVVSNYPIGTGMSCWISRTRRMRKVRLSICRLSGEERNRPASRIVYYDRDTHQKCYLYDIFAVVQFIKMGELDKVVGVTSTRHLFNREMNERLKSGKTAQNRHRREISTTR